MTPLEEALAAIRPAGPAVRRQAVARLLTDVHTFAEAGVSGPG